MSTQPIHTSCRKCGENWPGLVSAKTGLCPNCRDTRHKHISHCPVCGRADVPAQSHHIASKRQNEHVVIRICLSCHIILTKRQCTCWDPSWKTESHPVRCLVQGLADLIWLWWQRSGLTLWRNQLGEIAHVAWVSLLSLANQVWGLRGWEDAL